MENMNKTEALPKLTNGTSEEKIEVLENLMYEEIPEQFLVPIANCASDNDKGVRNAATTLMLSHPHKTFSDVVVNFVDSSDVAVRNLAGEILIKMGSLSVEPIIKYDHKNDNDTIKFVVDVLGLIRDSSSSKFIMDILSTSENDNVILACIEALGNISYDGAAEIIILLYDRNELYKPTAVEALGKIGSPVGLNFLMEKFAEEDELTKYSILDSLGELGDIDTYFFLLERINDVSGPLVLPLITSIAKLKNKFSLDIPFDNRMKNLLIYTLNEGSPDHQRIAFSMIESFDDSDILTAGLNLLGRDYELDEMIRSKIYSNSSFIYREVSKIINPSSENLRNVVNLFASTVSYVKDFQIKIDISILELRGIVHTMSGLLEHHDEEVRKSAMEILFNLDPESALLFVDTMANDENMWNRLRLLEILELIEGENSNSAILKLAGDPDEMIRERAEYIVNSRNINHLSN
jgi:HEAT repeat protein